MKRTMILLLKILVVAYLTVMVFAYVLQRALLYPAPPPGTRPSGGTVIELSGPDGDEGGAVVAYHIPAPEGAPTLVYFHGNAEDLASGTGFALWVAEAGLGFYGIEYPGYGLAPGKPTEEGIFRAARLGIGHLLGPLALRSDDLILVGRSLGTGVATEMARLGFGARMILLSPYTSVVDMGAKAAPFLPARLLVRDRFDTAAKAPGIEMPVLIIHGERDEVIPVSMGRRLSELFANANIYVAKDVGHNDLFSLQGGALRDRIAAFARGADYVVRSQSPPLSPPPLPESFYSTPEPLPLPLPRSPDSDDQSP